MVVIRLSRAGAKKRPFYHVVVTNKASSRDGRFIERIGFYNPIASGKATALNINLERAEYWINQGAQPSDRVQSLLKDQKKQSGSDQATAA